MEPQINKKILELVDKSYKIRHRYQSDYFWNTRMKVNAIFNDGSNNVMKDISESKNGFSDADEFRKRLFNSFDKINAIFYHLEKLKEEEELVMQLSGKIAEESEKINKNPGVIVTPLESINYEFESFIMQAKACLDVFCYAVGYYYKNVARFSTFEKMIKNCNAKKLLKILDSNEYEFLVKEFISKEQEKSKRDFSSHYGSLPVGQLNMPINSNGQKILKSFIVDHLGKKESLPKKPIEIEQYCNDVFYEICEFMVTVLETLFDEKFERGKKNYRK